MDKPVIDLTVNEYLSRAASGEPTPGGGSVSALSGALAASMAEMVCAFTISSKRCADNHKEAGEIKAGIEKIRERLTALSQEDIDCYSLVSESYALPRSTEEEKAERSCKIKEACAKAMIPPLDTVRALTEMSEMLPRLAEIGNKNLITDTGVAASLCLASVKSAGYNVRINLPYIGDEAKAVETEKELNDCLCKTQQNCESAEEKVKAAF